MTFSRSRAFTLVELLVVITIIGVLVALLLPAIQSAREAARRVQCKNQLHQLAIGALSHEEQLGHFPTGGWGPGWVGDTDRGFGQDQPGGWAYNILPFVEESDVHDLPADGKQDILTEEQLEGAEKLLATVLPIINCPSRREAKAYPHWHGHFPLFNAHIPEVVGKLDYAMNAGEYVRSVMYGDAGGGRYSLTRLEDLPTYVWCYDRLGRETSYCFNNPNRNPVPNPLLGDFALNGVSFGRSEVGIRHVLDGTSHTYLIGEKHVEPSAYEGTSLEMPFINGEFVRDVGDVTAWCVGSWHPGHREGASPVLPDAAGVPNPHGFGSAHSVGFHMSYCDGSVRVVGYDIDETVHLANCNRQDGLVLP